jgi:hypothetical protein
MRGVVLQMREGGGLGGRGGNDNRSLTNRTAQRTASVVSVNGSSVNDNATTNDNSVDSEITERGSQNGRSIPVPMATTDTSKPAVHGWHMPSYLVCVALAHNVLRFHNLILDTAVPMKLITTRTRSVSGRIGGSLSSPARTVMSTHSPQIINRN